MHMTNDNTYYVLILLKINHIKMNMSSNNAAMSDDRFASWI